MRSLCLLLIVAFCSPAWLVYSLDLPRDTYKHNQLAEAQAKAEEEGKPLVFLYTDPGTS